MAILRAVDLEVEFSYHHLTKSNCIIYGFNLNFSGKPFFNPEIINQTSDFWISDNGSDKFLIFDCEWNDWLRNYFVRIKETRKGVKIGTTEPPNFYFEAITWEDKKIEKEKSWEGKTIAIGENRTITPQPYAEVFKEFFEFMFVDNIDFIIKFPARCFIGENKGLDFNEVVLTVKTNFESLTSFLEELEKEREVFFTRFSDRITYLENGNYKTIKYGSDEDYLV